MVDTFSFLDRFMQNHLQGNHNLCMFLSSRPYLTDGYVSTVANQEDQVLEETVRELSLNIRQSLVLTKSQQSLNAREFILRRCGQTKPLPFLECYPDT